MAELPTLGIIAGAGKLPLELVETCINKGRDFFLLTFEDIDYHRFPAGIKTAEVRLGAIGEAFKHLRKAGVKELVMVGHIKRPSLRSLKPDTVGAKLLGKLGKAFFAGDNTLLTAVIKVLEAEGFKVVGVETILENVLAPSGIYGKVKPDAGALEDIKKGMKIVKQLGAMDIGQSLVIEDGYVIALEAAEGTDKMMQRSTEMLRAHDKRRSGVLIKAKKPGQENRVDLPTIGPDTIKTCIEASLLGIAVEAGTTLIIDVKKCTKLADAGGIFLCGVKG